MASERIGAVITAAGRGERMRGGDKLFVEIGGRALLARTVDTFERCEAISEIVLVLAEENLERGRELTRLNHWSKLKTICAGGQRRQDSVREGLRRLSDCQWAVIHDGARPLVTPELILRGVQKAHQTGAAIAAVPVKDTIKRVSPEGLVMDTPLRDGLWAVQTPQVFRFDLIMRAHETITEDVTDDAAMIERMGGRVSIYMGDYENIKVTTPEDLILVEMILQRR